MAKLTPLKIIFWAATISLFAGLSVGAWFFIQQTSASAAKIHDVERAPRQPEKPLATNEPILEPMASSPFENTGNSTGQDVVINAGDFIYNNGETRVRLLLNNQGTFPATAVYVSLNLFLDGSHEPVAQIIGSPVLLNGALYPSEKLMIEIPVQGEAWQSEQVAQASKRKIVVQIVSVADGNNDNADYPQISEPLTLNQVKPVSSEQSQDDNPPEEDETASEPETSQPENEPILHEDEPTGEPRIIHFEEKTTVH